jgi:hypothetical protein
MKTPLLFIILFFILMSCTSTEFYVSPTGNDRNQGTKKEPFMTIQRAQQAVRTQLANKHTGDLTVWLGDGNYLLSEPLKFRPEDSVQSSRRNTSNNFRRDGNRRLAKVRGRIMGG